MPAQTWRFALLGLLMSVVMLAGSFVQLAATEPEPAPEAAEHDDLRALMGTITDLLNEGRWSELEPYQ